MTGRRSAAEAAAVQTFRYRQSSLAFGESGRSTETFRRPRPFGCMQTSPKWSAFLTPSHFATGCGGRQRRSPIGGVPNGMPLKARTPGPAATPDTRPASVRTGSGTAPSSVATAAAARANRPARLTTMPALMSLRLPTLEQPLQLGLRAGDEIGQRVVPIVAAVLEHLVVRLEVQRH